MLRVVTGVDRFSLSPCKVSPIYHSIAAHHNAAHSALIPYKQEATGSSPVPPTNVFNVSRAEQN